MAMSLIALLFLAIIASATCVTLNFPSEISAQDGPANYQEGKRLFQARDYDKAAMHFWRATLMQEQNKEAYSVQEIFQLFMQCFQVQDRVPDGFVFIAQESIGRGQYAMGKTYLSQALAMDPNHEEALLLKDNLEALGFPLDGLGAGRSAGLSDPDEGEEDEEEDEVELEYGSDRTPEELYGTASDFFANKEYEKCADVFEISCQKSGQRLSPSCANAVYCRNMIIDWGFNGTQFDDDMKRIERISRLEVAQFRQEKDGSFDWARSMSTHPHMVSS
jgi:tetratricopeptide (TPR) repeat protein